MISISTLRAVVFPVRKMNVFFFVDDTIITQINKITIMQFRCFFNRLEDVFSFFFFCELNIHDDGKQPPISPQPLGKR